VLPQAGQGASGVQLGDRVQAGREVLGGRPTSSVYDLTFITESRFARVQRCDVQVCRRRPVNLPAGVTEVLGAGQQDVGLLGKCQAAVCPAGRPRRLR
jgi:hypothetical protein